MKYCIDVIYTARIACLIAEYKSSKGGFTSLPSNSAAFVGSDVILRCATNGEKVAWRLNGEYVYSGYEVIVSFASRFKVIQEKDGQCDLQIHHSQSSDAGEYMCGRTEPVSAQLVVVGKT